MADIIGMLILFVLIVLFGLFVVSLAADINPTDLYREIQSKFVKPDEKYQTVVKFSVGNSYSSYFKFQYETKITAPDGRVITDNGREESIKKARRKAKYSALRIISEDRSLRRQKKNVGEATYRF